MSLQELKAGFAKIQGEDFEYYVQSYSVMLGRNSKKATVDLDLAGKTEAKGEGDGPGGMNISRSHARIFYDFQLKGFMLEVLGKNGVLVNGDLKAQGSPPAPLVSQDLLQVGDRKFYFLLPAPPKERTSERPKATGGKRKKTKGGDTAGPAVKQRWTEPLDEAE